MKKRIWDVKIVPPYANYVVLLCLILFFLPQRVSVLQIRIPGAITPLHSQICFTTFTYIYNLVFFSYISYLYKYL